MSLKSTSKLMSLFRAEKKDGRKANRVRQARKARVESLETRSLLSVSPIFGSMEAGLPTVEYPVVSTADFDGDGDLDLFASDDASGGLYRNDGTALTLITGVEPIAFGDATWGDFDNDGDLDLVLIGDRSVTSWDTPAGSTIARIYWNDSGLGGSYTDLPGGGLGYASVDAGDFDNDGDLDLLATGHANGDLSTKSNPHTYIYVNDGGSFTRTAPGDLPGVVQSQAVWGDVNNDGLLDIVINGCGGYANGSVGVAAYTQDADGGWTEHFITENRRQSTTTTMSLAVGDFNGDGNLDVAAGVARLANSSPAIRIYAGAGNGSFSLSGEATFPQPYVHDGSIAMGDYDNDGLQDLLVSGGWNNDPAIISWNGSSWNYDVAKTVNDSSGARNEFPASGYGYGYGAVVWGDVDRDGTLDVAMAGHNEYDYPPVPSPIEIFVNVVGAGGVTNANSGPDAPTNLSTTSTVDIVNGEPVLTVDFAWDMPANADDSTSNAALTYDLYLLNGAGDIVAAAMANTSTGLRSVARGGLITETEWTITNLDPNDTYTWGVQAVDAAYVGSAFTAGAFTPVSTFSGTVYDDADGDEVGDTPLEGIEVVLYSDDGGTITQWGTATTAADGTYSITVTNGDYGLGDLYLEAKEQDLDSNRIDSFPAGGRYQYTSMDAHSGSELTGQDFGSYVGGSITVQLFEDLNANGVHDAGEPGLSGVDVTLDAPVDEFDRTITSDGTVDITFGALPNGTYTISVNGAQMSFDVEDLAAGPFTLASGSGDPGNSTVGTPDAQTDVLPQFNYVNIDGVIYTDVNADGDLGDGVPLAGAVVTLSIDTDKDGTADSTQAITTDGSGAYNFGDSYTLLPNVNYSIDVAPPDGTYILSPGLTDSFGPFADTESGDHFTNDTGYYQLATVNGTYYNDLDGDGVQDAGESGIPFWVLLTRLNGDSTWTDIPQMPDANGDFSYTDLTPGRYLLTALYPNSAGEGWSISPVTIDLNPLASGSVVTQDFGANVVNALKGGFEEINLLPDSFDNGSGAKTILGIDDFVHFWQGATFLSTDYDATFDSWSGFAVSNMTDTTTAGDGNQYSVYTGAAAEGSNFAIGYDATGWGATPTINLLPGFEDFGFRSIQVTNTTYAALSMLNGDAFSDAFTTGDYFKLVITGLDASGAPLANANPENNVIEVYLADYRTPGEEFILDTWQEVDLTVLTGAAGLEFSIVSSDAMKPFYFALDDIQVAGEISGVKYEDVNANGVRDAGESLLAGWDITIDDGNGYTAVATTDANGYYEFNNLLPGDYTLTETVQTDWTASNPSTGSQVVTVNSTAGWIVDDADFGNYRKIDISGSVIEDMNGDGLLTGDTGWGGVEVQLHDGGGLVASVNADVDGNYLFADVIPGDYEVRVIGVYSYFTVDGDGTVDGIYDVTAVSGQDMDLDALAGYGPIGMTGYVTIEGVVFTDLNANGVQETGDVVYEGADVELSGGDLASPITLTTDANGVYSFTGLHAGYDYTVTYVAPDELAGYFLSTVGSHDETATLSRQTRGADDFGIYEEVVIDGVVFADTNSDGVFDVTESGYAGLDVQLWLVGGGAAVQTVQTDANGAYSFDPQDPGDYEVRIGLPTAISYYTNDDDGVLPVGVLESGADVAAPSLGIAEYVSFSGTVFEDMNGDGVIDTDPAFLLGAEIQLIQDTNDDGIFDETPIATTTSSLIDGTYEFGTGLGLEAGYDYQIAIVDPTGDDYDATTTTPLQINDTESGVAYGDVDFGVALDPVITGVVFGDDDLSGDLSGAESGLDGVTVQLWTADGLTYLTETITLADGSYELVGSPNGSYLVKVIKASDEYFTDPANLVGEYTTGTLLSHDMTNLGSIGIVEAATISATAFEDLDGDGVRTTEGDVAGFEIEVVGDIDGDGVDDIFTIMTGDAPLQVFPGDYTMTLISTAWTGTPDVDPIVVDPTDAGTVDFAATPVSLTVTTDQDGIVADGLLSLREALLAANSSAGLDAIDFDLATPATITLTDGVLNVLDTVDIVGPGTMFDLTIDADGASGIFSIDGVAATLSLSNMTLTNGSAIAGGAIYANGPDVTVTVLGSNLHTNTADDGGAIFAGGGAFVTLEEVVLATNEALGSGGAIAAMGVDTTVVVMSNTTTSVPSTFASNKAALFGGDAFATNGAMITIDSAAMSGLASGGPTGFASAALGGSVAAYQGGMINLIDTEVSSYKASLGGAVFSGLGGSMVDVGGSEVMDNYADRGAAVMAYNDALVTIDSSTVHDNEAVGFGGAIAVEGVGATVDVTSLVTDSNLNGNKAGTSGGAVYVGDGAMFTMIGGEIDGNASIIGRSAISGGGVAVYGGGSATLRDMTISDNDAVWGGGAFASGAGSSLTLDNVLVQDNSAVVRGGGIGLNAGAHLDLIGSSVIGNSSDYAGGGVYCSTGSTVTATGVNDVSGNTPDDTYGWTLPAPAPAPLSADGADSGDDEDVSEIAVIDLIFSEMGE